MELTKMIFNRLMNKSKLFSFVRKNPYLLSQTERYTQTALNMMKNTSIKMDNYCKAQLRLIGLQPWPKMTTPKIPWPQLLPNILHQQGFGTKIQLTIKYQSWFINYWYYWIPHSFVDQNWSKKWMKQHFDVWMRNLIR